MSEDHINLIEKILRNDRLANFRRYWVFCLALSAFFPMLGVDRLLPLAIAPISLLVFNAYVLGLLFIQTKKPLMDRASTAVPKFFLYALNSFLLFAMLPLGALVFIPGAMAEMGATMLVPFTTATALMGIFIYLISLLLMALGAALAVIQGRIFINDGIQLD